jgi:hypothetical protein
MLTALKFTEFPDHVSKDYGLYENRADLPNQGPALCDPRPRVVFFINAFTRAFK